MKHKKKDGGSTIFFGAKREGVGRIRLTDGMDLVVFMVGEHLDMRLWVDRRPYKGLRFYLPEGVYEELKRLIEKVDKVYQERLELSGILDPRGGEQSARSRYHYIDTSNLGYNIFSKTQGD